MKIFHRAALWRERDKGFIIKLGERTLSSFALVKIIINCKAPGEECSASSARRPDRSFVRLFAQEELLRESNLNKMD